MLFPHQRSVHYVFGFPTAPSSLFYFSDISGLRSGKDITVYTFGEPRVGDYTFAKKFNSMISERYPHSMEHGSEYKECLSEPYGEDPHCSDSLSFPEIINIEDHTHYFGIEGVEAA
ncbi:hypothetical protein COOONC_15773 [Cooperia oncophora]